MKRLILIASATFALCTIAVAQTAHTDHGAHQHTSDTPEQATDAARIGLTQAKMVRFDQKRNRVLLEHQEIVHLQMPPMRMYFTLTDNALWDKITALGVDSTVCAKLDQQKGAYLLLDVQPLPCPPASK